jgi:hypothetical protein
MADLDGEAHRGLIVCAKATSIGLHRSAVLPTRPMIFAALVAHLRIIHRIQAAERFRKRWIIFEQTALDWIKALGNLPRSTFLGALFVGLQESALDDESAAHKREADDDQRDTQSTHFTTAKMGILSRAAAAPNALFPLGARQSTGPQRISGPPPMTRLAPSERHPCAFDPAATNPPGGEKKSTRGIPPADLIAPQRKARRRIGGRMTSRPFKRSAGRRNTTAAANLRFW